MKKFLTFLVAGAMLTLTGAVLVHCGSSNSGGCTSNADCAATEYCDLTTKKCKPNTTCNQTEKCADLCCGDPCSTGTECPDNCGTGKTCNTSTCQCEACQPDCGGKQCGDDGCGGSCGSCTGTDTCNADGQCVACQKDCTNKQCGDDGCGGSCGTCNTGEHCDANGTCVAGGSEPGDPCPNGDSDCPADWPTCLSGGGMTYCTKACTTDADCGDPSCCLDAGGAKYCFDQTQCPGTGALGDPCPFDTVNADAVNCSSDLMCLGIAADGNSGTCTTDSDCSSLGDAINPDCVSGNCGASFCAEECPNGDSAQCPSGTSGQDISGTCYCIPSTVSSCTDPINNVGCQAGEKCVPYQGSELACVAEGTQDLGEVCGQGACGGQDCWCKAGQMCLGSGAGSCYQICDADNNTGCPGAAGDYYCIGITDIDHYGGCIATPTCTLESGGSECDSSSACIINDSSCSEFRCFITNGVAIGASCQYSNDCVNGAICNGTPATCVEVCNDGHSCSSGTCSAVDGCDTGTGQAGGWGLCQ